MVDESYDYLLEPVREIAAQNKESRLAYIARERWFSYRRARQAQIKLSDLLKSPTCQRMPNLLIIGPTNNGKSTLIEKFLRDNPPIVPNDDWYGKHVEIPVLAIQMPSGPDIKRFYGTILYKIGLRVPRSQRIGSLESDVLTYLKQLKVKMLVIDEIHNVLSGRAPQQREFLNLLRFLGNELRVPLVCVGTKEAYLAIRSDDQLENRFEPFPLPPWGMGEEYNSLLASFAAIFPLQKKSDLLVPAIAQRILLKTGGVLGEISTLLTKAASWAVSNGYERIDEYVLSRFDYQSPLERRKIFERELR